MNETDRTREGDKAMAERDTLYRLWNAYATDAVRSGNPVSEAVCGELAAIVRRMDADHVDALEAAHRVREARERDRVASRRTPTDNDYRDACDRAAANLDTGVLVEYGAIAIADTAADAMHDDGFDVDRTDLDAIAPDYV